MKLFVTGCIAVEQVTSRHISSSFVDGSLTAKFQAIYNNKTYESDVTYLFYIVCLAQEAQQS